MSVRLSLAPMRHAVTVVSDQGKGFHRNLSTLFSTSMDGDELRLLFNNTGDMLRYVTLRAGVMGAAAVYVDGLPAAALPPAQMVARITVNADPFSAEFSDGDRGHIEITTRGSDRKLRFNMGGSSLGFGGHDTLISHAGARSRNGGGALSGPVPGTPFVFSAHLNFGYSISDVPILAVSQLTAQPAEIKTTSARTGNYVGGGSLDLYYSRGESFRASFAYSESRARGSNNGVGGLTLSDAGLSSRFMSRSARATFNGQNTKFAYRGGILFTGVTAATRANTSGAGVTVEGYFTGGGAPMSSSSSKRATWTFKNVLTPRSASSAWSTGITVSRLSEFQNDVPNPSGSFRFRDMQAYLAGVDGGGTATWAGVRGNGAARFTTTLAAPFFQRELLRSRHFLLMGGLRGDWQTGFGTPLSPRLSAAVDLNGFVVRLGGGLFVQSLPAAVLLRLVQNDGVHLSQFMATGVPYGEGWPLTVESHDAIRTRRAADLTQARQWMQRASLERPLRKFTPGIEYTWTRDRHLLGSRRLRDGTGWLDILEPNRSSNRQRFHAQLRYRGKVRTLAVHYEWSDYRDDTDGAVSFPVYQDDIRAEWSRSAGVSPHALTLTSSLQIRGGIFLSLVDTLRSSAPYNITTGIDVTNNGLYNDRGGRARNSGNGPSFNSLGLHSSKRLSLPGVGGRLQNKLYVTVGIQGENLLGNRNYTGFGSIAGAPTFGLPLGTLPGRSVRFWINFG